jgi:hypothetical protein
MQKLATALNANMMDGEASAPRRYLFDLYAKRLSAAITFRYLLNGLLSFLPTV